MSFTASNKLPNVQVFLSTYNGERYIEQQLDSLLKQQDVNLYILIRDDGSEDNTLSILEQYTKTNNNMVTLLRGENIGAKASFFELIKLADQNYDFFAFCDQDDVWNMNKIKSAVPYIHNSCQNLPKLYCSITSIVDEQLNFISKWPKPPVKSINLYNSLVENTGVGCTMIFNKATLQLLQDNLPKNMNKVAMHDWWVYLSVSAFGKVYFDDNSYISYRQHSGNLIGAGMQGLIQTQIEKAKNFVRGTNKYLISSQAREFLDIYRPLLDQREIKYIEKIAYCTDFNFVNRFIFLWSSPFYCQSTYKNLILKIKLVTGVI